MVQTPQSEEKQQNFLPNFFNYIIIISFFFFCLFISPCFLQTASKYKNNSVSVQKALHVNYLLLSKYTSYSSELWTNICDINMTPQLYQTWNIKYLVIDKNILEMTIIIISLKYMDVHRWDHQLNSQSKCMFMIMLSTVILVKKASNLFPVLSEAVWVRGW